MNYVKLKNSKMYCKIDLWLLKLDIEIRIETCNEIYIHTMRTKETDEIKEQMVRLSAKVLQYLHYGMNHTKYSYANSDKFNANVRNFTLENVLRIYRLYIIILHIK